MGIAVGKSLLSCIETELRLISFCSRYFGFLTSGSIRQRFWWCHWNVYHRKHTDRHRNCVSISLFDTTIFDLNLFAYNKRELPWRWDDVSLDGWYAPLTSVLLHVVRFQSRNPWIKQLSRDWKHSYCEWCIELLKAKMAVRINSLNVLPGTNIRGIISTEVDRIISQLK